MRVLVAGAAGFIGSTLTDRLIAEGHDVVGVDNLSTGRLDNLAEARGANKWRRGAFSFLRMSVTDPALAENVAHERPEVVCHLAATGDIAGTACVLAAAAGAGVRKMVFTSGTAIYGTQSHVPVSERVRPSPETPEAAAQAAGELYLHAYEAMCGLEWTTLVLADVYGPRCDVVPVPGDGRDYVYVDDVVDAYVRALDRGSGRRFNIGTGVVLDPTAARGGLGWEPWTSLADGVRATVDWRRAAT